MHAAVAVAAAPTVAAAAFPLSFCYDVKGIKYTEHMTLDYGNYVCSHAYLAFFYNCFYPCIIFFFYFSIIAFTSFALFFCFII